MHSPTALARRAQIVRAAIDTIADLGYDKASFAKITERAGLSSPRLISYHFANKDDLMRQVVVDIYTMAVTVLNDRIQLQTSVADQLTAYLEANLAFVRDHPAEVRVLTAIGPHLRDDLGRPYTSTSAQDGDVQVLEALLRQGQRAGEFRDFDAGSMAVLIRGAIMAAIQRAGDEPGMDLDRYQQELVTTCHIATRRA